ncbi:MAG: hypothetical protein EP330_31300 [Deltaproteobacteria bacterium]|nr:MAG: hypothetical protein EP330_31300 [Deltaproteobacteria bacterium]
MDLVEAERVVGDLIEGDVVASLVLDPLTAGVDASFALCAPAVPRSADLYTLDSAPGMSLATYSLRARASGGEWVGASWPMMLTWLEGSLSTDLIDSGAAPGWNVLHLLREEGVPFTDTTDFDFDANLLMPATPVLSGTMVPDLSAHSDLVVGAYNINRIADSSMVTPPNPSLPGTPATSTGASTAFALTLASPPPDHTEAFDGLFYAEAGYYMVGVWSDTSGDERWQPTEETMHANSTSATPERWLYFLEPLDWRASVMVDAGWPMGWSVLESGQYVAWSEGLTLDAP